MSSQDTTFRPGPFSPPQRAAVLSLTISSVAVGVEKQACPDAVNG